MIVNQTTYRFNTGEVELAYTDLPGDSPPVVIFHGSTASRDLWVANSSFRGSLRALAYDARGHGESDWTPNAYRFLDFGRDAVAFVERVAGEPSILVGHSMGAMMAIYVAATRSELVRGIVLADPPLYLGETGLRNMQAPMELWRSLAGKPVAELIAAGQTEGRARTLNLLDPTVLDFILSGALNEGWDTDALLQRIECPVLLQHGEQSLGSVLYEGEVERATAYIKYVTIAELKGSGHSALVANPDGLLTLFSSFIDEVKQAPPGKAS
jgi:pimeloyl-ACP methyl ester carboxylesterase